MQTRYEPSGRAGTGQKKVGKSGGGLRKNLTLIRLVSCLVLLGGVMVLKTFFPATAETVRATVLPLMEQEIDYRGSIAAIGETLTGETSITEVLGDLYVRAFGGAADPDVEVSAELEDEEPDEAEDEEQSLVPLSTNPPIEEVIPTPTVAPVTETVTEEPTAAEEGEPEAVAVFKAQQEAYSDYALPTGVTYDYIALDLDYTLPVSGPVSSTFGYRWHPLDEVVKFHYGTDVAVDTGTPFVAFAAGTVTEAAESDSWGLYLVIDHGDGVTTRYAHCNALYVGAGEAVEAGQTIGEVGATGNVTGPHLHFELRVDGVYLNPEYYMTFYA